MNVNDTIARLRGDGWAQVGQLTPAQVAETVGFLQGGATYPDCHVRYTAGPVGSFDSYLDREVVCHHHFEVLLAPHLLELALGVTDVAASWLGVNPPVLYSANAFWTRPGAQVRPDIQEFHRDKDNTGDDSTGFLPLFVLLTDVTEDDGAQEIEVDGRVRRIHGPAGMAFLSDTSRLHRGLKPRTRERGIAWLRWGAGRKAGRPPAAYEWDQLTPIDARLLGRRYPADLRLRQSLQLLAR